MIEIPAILKSSGSTIRAHCHCPHLKNGHWFALDMAMTGDAPKDFLGVYEYGVPGCKRGRRKSWPRYIAKVGYKWYPNDSEPVELLTNLLKGEFARLISPLRQTWICRLLEYRTKQFRLTLQGEPTDA